MKPVLSLVLVICLSLACLDKAAADSLTLSWYPSTSADVTGYDVYYGTNSGNYPFMVNVGSATSVTIANLSPGVTYYFAATAYDAEGDQSAFSGQIGYLVPGKLTMAPGATPGEPGVMQFSVAPGHGYELDATTDLIHWSSIWQSSVVTTNGWMQFTDPAPGPYALRCYRLVQH